MGEGSVVSGVGGVRRGQESRDSGTFGAAAVLERQHVEEFAQGHWVHGRALQGGLPSRGQR